MKRIPGGSLLCYVIAALAVVALGTTALAAGESDKKISAEDTAFFEKEVRPLLVESCYQCHGPKKQESGLRVDSRGTLMSGGDSGPAIEPGKPAASLLLQAVRQEGDLKMPPKTRLKDEQIAVLERWIERDAPWPNEAKVLSVRSGGPSDEERKFWSFQSVSEPPVPVVKNAAWPRTPIDNFILAQHEAAGLHAAAAADRRTLIRRATFDLTGLPPTPAEVDEFLRDQSPAAFEKAIDRLLASRAYGERWGRHWLDVVRYADTAGETADYPVREAYKYRNYVINSFNRDKPYDQFLREQIAGDLLPAATAEQYREQVIATGYLAISRRFGFDSENYHYLTIQDTIDTLGQSVLGLTLGCARCHDHKFDPISTTDYYGLYGIFASSNYAFPGSEQKQRPREFAPLVPPAEAASKQASFDAQLAANSEELKKLDASKLALGEQIKAIADIDGPFELQSLDAKLAMPWGGVDGARVVAGAQSPYTNLYPGGSRGVTFPNDTANNAIEQTLTPVRTPATHELLYFNVDFRGIADAKGGDGSYRFYLGHGPGRSAVIELFANANTFFVRSGDAREAIRPIKLGEWYNVQLTVNLKSKTFSGTIGTPGDQTRFADKAFATGWDGTLDYFFVDGYGHIGGVKPAHEVDNVGIRDIAIAPLATTLDAATAKQSAGDIAQLAEQFAKLRGSLDELEKQRVTLQQQRAALVEQGPYEVAYAVYEGVGKNAQIQKRGEPTKLGDEVPRHLPEILGGDVLPANFSGSGRLQLAEWLTRPSNPLTARVMVNRIWQQHFGTGLVATENDFGTRGARPTHPDLLDYLAARFVAGGWSIKSLHKQIMLSQTYQLASAPAGDDIAARELFDRNAGIDAGNALLWRFARHRLSAEAIRDAMLAVSGKLEPAPTGGHPFPPVDTWSFSQHVPFSAVYDHNRRSVYLMTQRIKRHPYLALFDGADPNVSTARRIDTTVPTQALFMMNDPFVHVQSNGVAQQLIGQRVSQGERVELAYQKTLSRAPTPAEAAAADEFLAAYGEQLKQTSAPAEQHTLLALSAFCRTLLVSNEFLFVD